MKNIVYILLSIKHPKSYVGITSNIAERLIQRNKGCNYYSRKYKPWRVVYTEKCKSETEALNRERYLKSHAGRDFIKKLLQKIQ